MCTVYSKDLQPFFSCELPTWKLQRASYASTGFLQSVRFFMPFQYPGTIFLVPQKIFIIMDSTGNFSPWLRTLDSLWTLQIVHKSTIWCTLRKCIHKWDWILVGSWQHSYLTKTYAEMWKAFWGATWLLSYWLKTQTTERLQATALHWRGWCYCLGTKETLLHGALDITQDMLWIWYEAI